MVSLWLDQDPGHDDAIATLLAVSLPNLNLVGISTVHGNGSLVHTTRMRISMEAWPPPLDPRLTPIASLVNATRVLCSFASPEDSERIRIYSGAVRPLLRPVKHDTEIHGDDGLGGVEGLFDRDNERVRRKLAESEGQNAVLAMAAAARSMKGGEGDENRLAIVATGTLTNVALFCATFPELICDKVSQIILMGGAEGRGNRSPTAEFNILCDPEAAAIVFDAEVKVVMMPLNVTHTALFTPSDNARLLQQSPKSPFSTGAKTPLRHTISTLLMFFASTYEKVFGFVNGPPVHDPLCVAYLTHPELFKGKRYRVDVELAGTFTAGTTSVDLWDYRLADLTAFAEDPSSRESWGRFGKNVWVAEEVDVAGFWRVFQEAVDAADLVSPLNKEPV